MKIFPAIDLKNGEVVRLVEGDYNNKKTYFTNPMEVLDFLLKAVAKFAYCRFGRSERRKYF